MSLQEIGEKHGTDKATHHHYLDFYERVIQRERVRRFLEIGVLKGASLRTWREWLPDSARVEGWDVDSVSPVPGCLIRRVDQTDRLSLQKACDGFFDYILDDGAHTARAQQTSLSFLFPQCRYYVLEDIHAHKTLPYLVEPEDRPTLEILESFPKKGWASRYASPAEIEYIHKNMEVVEIFRGSGLPPNPDSITALVRNKRYA